MADPEALDAASRGAREWALANAGFVFEITRVLEIEEEVEIRHWRVETRQGERRFQTRLDDWPRALPGGAHPGGGPAPPRGCPPRTQEGSGGGAAGPRRRRAATGTASTAPATALRRACRC